MRALAQQNSNIYFTISVTDDLKNLVVKLENRVSQLEKGSGNSQSVPAAKPAPAAKPVPAKAADVEEEDDVDLFGSESEDEEAAAEKVAM